MPAALSKLPNPDTPLRKLAPSGGWIEREPMAYAVRARHAEEVLSLAIFCHYVLQGRIPQEYARREEDGPAAGAGTVPRRRDSTPAPSA